MSHGPCHCGCGGLAPIADETRTARGEFRGKPLRFIKGHNRRLLPGNLGGACLTRNGVSTEELRPDLLQLHRRYGSWVRVALSLDVPYNTLRYWRSRSQHVSIADAMKIRRAVVGSLPRSEWEKNEKRRRDVEDQRRRREGIRDGTWVLRRDRS
jgi:hypothetical protein